MLKIIPAILLIASFSVNATWNKEIMSEVQMYTSMMRTVIQHNLVVDESMKDKKCRISIKIADDGMIKEVAVLNGDYHVCIAAKAAIHKAERLPISSKPDVYNKLKEINLTVQPEFN